MSPELLAGPEALTLEAFNHEVWRVDSGTTVSGQRVDHAETLGDERVAELEAALDRGEVEFHGNGMWGSGSRSFGSSLRLSDEEKLDIIRRAISILN